MSVINQINSSGGDWSDYYRRLHSGDDKPRGPKIYTKREADGTWSSFTRNGWWQKKRFTTGSRTPYEAQDKHRKKIETLKRIDRDKRKPLHY